MRRGLTGVAAASAFRNARFAHSLFEALQQNAGALDRNTTWFDMRFRIIFVACLLMLAGFACRSPSEPVDRSLCPHSSEFENYGCAALVVIVTPPPTPWPVRTRWDVRAVPLRSGSGVGIGFADPQGPGTSALPLTRINPSAPESGDTLSVRVIATFIDQDRSTVFAVDSVVHVARFVPVGRRPPVDTVSLALRIP